MMMDLQCLTIAEVAEALKVCDETVRQLLKRGELPFVQVGKSRRILVSDLRAYVLGGRNPPLEEETPEAELSSEEEVSSYGFGDRWRLNTIKR